MTNITNLLIDNGFSTYYQHLNRLNAFVTAKHDLGLNMADIAALRHLIDTYGVTYRGAAAVREYLDNR